MNTFLKFIPGLANDAKEKIAQTITSFNQEDSVYFQKQNLTQEAILQQLDSQYPADIVDGIKRVLALLLTNKNISIYISRVIGHILNENQEIKRLSYIIIQEASLNTEYSNELLMAVSPLLKNITTPKTYQKGISIKTLSNINIAEIQQILLSTINKLVNDKSGFPKRIVLNSYDKINQRPGNLLNLEQVNDLIKPMLKDRPFVSGAAFQVYYNLNIEDTKLEWFHEYFYFICKNLKNYSPFDQVFIMKILFQYSVIYFSHLKNSQEQKEDNQQEGNADQEDLKILLNCVDHLLLSTQPSLILEIGNILLEFPVESYLRKYVKTLMRFISISSESKIIILQQLEKIAYLYPDYVTPYYKQFYITQIEKVYCRTQKIVILGKLVNENNVEEILKELNYYTKGNQKQIAKQSIDLIGNIASRHSFATQSATKYLLNMLKTSSAQQFMDQIISNLVSIIKQNIEENLAILIFCLKKIPEIQNSTAKASLIENLVQICHIIPTMSLEYLRKLSQTFQEEQINVKYQIISLAFRIATVCEYQDQKHQETLAYLFNYVLTQTLYDQNIMLRDQGRFVKNLVLKDIEDKSVLNNDVQNTLEKLKQLKESEKEYINSLQLHKSQENEQIYQQKCQQEQDKIQEQQFQFNNIYQIGSLSHYFKEKVKGYIQRPFEHEISQVSTHHLRQISTQEDQNFNKINDNNNSNNNNMVKQEENLVNIQEKPQNIENEKIQQEENQIQEKQEQENQDSQNQQNKMLQNLNKELDDFFQ